jgi:hypothetical protein
MLFFTIFMINLVLTKSSGPKHHAVLLTTPIFAGFCVHYKDLGGGDSSYSSFPLTPRGIPPFSNFYLNKSSLKAVG